MGFKPVSYKEVKKDIIKNLRIIRESFETDDGTADPRTESIIQPETTQEAWDKLLGLEASRIAREIDKADNKHISGSLEDIRERLMIK